VITASLTPADASALARQAIALQLAAVAVDARLEDPIIDFGASRATSPAANGGAPVSLSLALPMDKSYIIFIQVPVDGRAGLGKMVARLRFPSGQGDGWSDVLSGRTKGISAPLSDLMLGRLQLMSAITASDSGPDIVIELGGSESINPLSTNDSDGDGTPDFDDADDDNDFVPDSVDDDANGDDIPDAVQHYDALLKWDNNGDHVPDLFQP